jgi:cytochrome P450
VTVSPRGLRQSASRRGYGTSEKVSDSKSAIKPQPGPLGPRKARDLDEILHNAGMSVASPDAYADNFKMNASFKLLRQYSPVHWAAPDGVVPFWAVTRHADILAVEQDAASFVASPRTVLSSEIADIGLRQLSGKDQLFRPLTHMDDPDHRAYRAITQSWFAPKNLSRIEDRLVRFARETVDRMQAHGKGCDFAHVAALYPLQVIMSILGVPDEDFSLMLRLTRGLLGADDDDRAMGEPPLEAIRIAMTEFREYFDRLTANRRAKPRDDLATVIAKATLDGKKIPDFERLSYYIVIATGAHDTTTFAITGGLHALIEAPEQLSRLKQEPQLLDRAIEEMLRWTTPLRHFMRTVRRDCNIGDTRIRAGDSLALFFNSGNRDEIVFGDSDVFRIDRNPNPHIAFGHGVHFCLGHYLAKMEMRAIFRELLPRLDHIEQLDEPQWARSAFIGGIKSLPIRYKLRAASQ